MEIHKQKQKDKLLNEYKKLPNNEKVETTLYKDSTLVVESKSSERREELLNQALAQDISLKKNTLIALFVFLAFETIVIFGFTFLQGTKKWEFMMEEWTFRLLITATITQITIMLQVAVKHLFPDGNGKEKSREMDNQA